MKFDSLTKEQIELLKDTSKTGQEICKILNCGIVTVSRWRKKLGVNCKRGFKKGKTKPWALRRKNLFCLTCNIVFSVMVSRDAKYCSKKCMSENVSHRNLLRNIDRSYMKTEKYKNTLIKETTPEYRRYRNKVSKLTEQTYMMYKNVINPNNLTRTLAGVENGYHLDHKISCRYGFDNNILPEEISSLKNLQMLPWRDNIVKGKK